MFLLGKSPESQLLRYEKSISDEPASLISKVQPCPTSSGLKLPRTQVCMLPVSKVKHALELFGHPGHLDNSACNCLPPPDYCKQYWSTLHLPEAWVQVSHVQLCVSQTRNTADTVAATTLCPSGDQETWVNPPPFTRFTAVDTPMGMSQIIKLQSAGEAETRKFP